VGKWLPRWVAYHKTFCVSVVTGAIRQRETLTDTWKISYRKKNIDTLDALEGAKVYEKKESDAKE